MALTRTRSKEKENQYKAKITWKEIKRQKVLLFWSGVMVIYGIILFPSTGGMGDGVPEL